MKLRNLTLATTVILLPSPAYAQYFECEACPAGTWNNGNYDSCQKCAAGTYSTGGASSCTNCPAGKYASSTGSASCANCPAGKYASSTGSASCTNCSAGTYSTGGASSCTKCAAGTYSGAGSYYCYPCPSGYYSNAGASSCTKCPAGTYSTGGASSCRSCLTTGVASCSSTTGKATSCKSGFGLLSGACSQCSAGTYSPGGTSGCYSCSSGYYSNAGASSCSNCLTTGVATCDSTTGKATSCVKGFIYDSQKNVCNFDCSAQGFLNATNVRESCKCEVIKVSDVITKIQNKNYKSLSECIEACYKSCGLYSEIAACYGSCHGYFSQNAEYHYCCKNTAPAPCNCYCPPGSFCSCSRACESIYNKWRSGCFRTSDSCSGDHPIKVESI